MEFAVECLWRISDAVVQLFMQPFLYIAIVFIIMQYRRQVMLERRLFAVKMHSIWDQVIRTLLGGLAAGLAISLLSLIIGMTITFAGMLMVWAVALILMCFRIRFLCIAYSVGVLAILQFSVNLFPMWTMDGWFGTILQTLRELNIPALMVFVALLHMAESVLIRTQGAKFAGPLFYAGKRGKLVGGYQLQGYWLIPLFFMVPSYTVGSVLPWEPFFGGDAWANGWSIMAFPVMIGFTEMTQSMLPKDKVRWSSKWIMIYSVILLVVAFGSVWWSPLIVLAAIVAIGMHEALVWYSAKEEAERSPLYVHDERGLHVLTVIPNTPAAELGIQAGEIIQKVNGIRVRTKEELHEAIRSNAAFCKLEVLNLAGDVKFLQRAIFAGEHHQLGVVLSPDQDAPYYVGMKQTSVLQLLRMKKADVQSRSRI